jgi:hypothetical protein
MTQYHKYLKDWTSERGITSFLGSDKPAFQQDWKEEKRAGVRFGEEMGREDINRAGEPFKKPVAKKRTAAEDVLDNPDLMNIIKEYIPSSKSQRVKIDGDNYIVKGDKIARSVTGIVIKDKKLVERLFKKLSAQRVAIANKMPIPEKKTRKPSKAQEEKASKEYMRQYNAMRADTAQGGLY